MGVGRKSEYIQAYESEGWFEIEHVERGIHGINLACCDCGLVHEFYVYKGRDGKMRMYAKRNPKETMIHRLLSRLPFVRRRK